MLARGPNQMAKRYNGYDINGYHFRTVDRDQSLKTQNSGVSGTFITTSVSSVAD
ncbi:hypothetical protein LINPERHAP1_LOCUS30189, partial [Linum perenne]